MRARLDEANAGVEPLGDRVDEAVVDAYLGLHFGVPLDESRQQPRQHERDRSAGYGEPNASRHVAVLCSHRLQRFERLVDGRSCVVEQPLSRVGQRHAARRARQKGDLQPLFELTNRLAPRGRRDAEILGCGGVGQPACDGDEVIKGVERS